MIWNLPNTPDFLTYVAENIMDARLGDFPSSFKVFSAFNDGIEAFLSAGTQIVFSAFEAAGAGGASGDQERQTYGFDAYNEPAFAQHYIHLLFIDLSPTETDTGTDVEDTRIQTDYTNGNQ